MWSSGEAKAVLFWGACFLSFVCLPVCVSAPARADTVIFETDTTIDDGDDTYEGYDVIVCGCTLTINGAHSFNSLTVDRVGDEYGVVTHAPGFTNGEVSGFHLTIATDVHIRGAQYSHLWSRIDVSGQGYG